ncbi:unnamed protein product [Lactuca saligna]|uniref:Uncharacterized protein n=1 Tax=Lactuca saligna TaxID=75948 RepID=A0AA35YWH2_LACSI|nr:unnamed protein product [Lactuca saligna]
MLLQMEGLVNINHQEIPAATAPPPPAAAATPPPVTTTPPPLAVTVNNENDGFDFFDPRGVVPAPALAFALQGSGGGEMEELFGSLSESFSSSNALAVVTSTSSITTEVHPPANTNPYLTFDTLSTSRVREHLMIRLVMVLSKLFLLLMDFRLNHQHHPSLQLLLNHHHFHLTQCQGQGDLGILLILIQLLTFLADILPPPGPSQTAFPSQNGQASSLSAEAAYATVSFSTSRCPAAATYATVSFSTSRWTPIYVTISFSTSRCPAAAVVATVSFSTSMWPPVSFSKSKCSAVYATVSSFTIPRKPIVYAIVSSFSTSIYALGHILCNVYVLIHQKSND